MHKIQRNAKKQGPKIQTLRNDAGDSRTGVRTVIPGNDLRAFERMTIRFDMVARQMRSTEKRMWIINVIIVITSQQGKRRNSLEGLRERGDQEPVAKQCAVKKLVVVCNPCLHMRSCVCVCVFVCLPVEDRLP